MLTAIADWSVDQQAILTSLIARRYLLKKIKRVHDIDLKHNHLTFNVETDHGKEQFVMRWSLSQAIDFGTAGKLLLDVEDNRYVVEDVSLLPNTDLERFKQYIYW